jgi:hypothetical protein
MRAEQTGCAAIPHSPIRGQVAGLTLSAEPWAAPHVLTVSIRDDRTRMVLDTEDANIACELRLGPQGLLRTWQHPVLSESSPAGSPVAASTAPVPGFPNNDPLARGPILLSSLSRGRMQRFGQIPVTAGLTRALCSPTGDSPHRAPSGSRRPRHRTCRESA